MINEFCAVGGGGFVPDAFWDDEGGAGWGGVMFGGGSCEEGDAEGAFDDVEEFVGVGVHFPHRGGAGDVAGADVGVVEGDDIQEGPFWAVGEFGEDVFDFHDFGLPSL